MRKQWVDRCDPHLPLQLAIWCPGKQCCACIFQQPATSHAAVLILEWLYLTHTPPSTLLTLPAMVSQLIAKGRRRCKMLTAQEPCLIVVPYTRAQFTELFTVDEALQIAWSYYFGSIGYHLPKDPRIQGSFSLPLTTKSILSPQPLEALTIFADGNPSRGTIAWQERGQWKYKITSPQTSHNPPN